MDECEAALTMLNNLDKQEKDFLVLMDRGYSSFNLIETCNRLKHCHIVTMLFEQKLGMALLKKLPHCQAMNMIASFPVK